MKSGPFESIPALLETLAMLAVAFAADWVGGLTESLTHNAFALTAGLITLFVSGRSAAPSEDGSRRLLGVATVAAIATMITR
jgi:hypothetical protein